MQKQRPIYNHYPELVRSIPNTYEVISRWSRKTKTTPIGRTKIGTSTKTKLSSTIPLLFIVSLKPRILREISVIKTVEEAI